MAVAPVLIGAGAAITAYGTIKENMDRSDAEKANADYYKSQAEYSRMIGQREEDIFYRKAQENFAQVEGAYAKGGVDINGSPLFVLENQVIRREQEVRAIRAESAKRAELGDIRAGYAQQRADQLSSTGYNLLTTAPTILHGASGVYGSLPKNA